MDRNPQVRWGTNFETICHWSDGVGRAGDRWASSCGTAGPAEPAKTLELLNRLTASDAEEQR